MPRFPRTLLADGVEACKTALKSELESLDRGTLPLASGTRQGGLIDDSRISATILEIHDGTDCLQARVGVFFTEIVGGCSCGDEPVSGPAYCSLSISIDTKTAEARFDPLPEDLP
jgi:hypothetical protein